MANTSCFIQEQKPHETHSFKFCQKHEPTINLTCDDPGTVEEVLKRSPIFTRVAKRNRQKELVILQEGNAISSRLPCSLLKNDCQLDIEYIHAGKEPTQSVPQNKGPSGALIMFHVLVKGGEGVKNILKNPALKNVTEAITVYAYKGETVKNALKRDGRLLDIIFTKTCVLSHKATKEIIEFSCLVDDIGGETFRIMKTSNFSPPSSQSGSLDDSLINQSEAQACDSDRNQEPAQVVATTESGNDSTPKEIPKGNTYMTAGNINNSKKTKSQLSSQVRDLEKKRKGHKVSKLSDIQNLFRVEFGKNSQTCSEVKTLKKLMERSDSVCQVRINGEPEGSGFLLFDRFVLTNGHVIKDVLDTDTGKLFEKVTVHFSFESLGETEKGVEVESVAGFEYFSDGSGQEFDWALLSLAAQPPLPECLLKYFGFLPQSGGICIIGHPDCAVKKIDPCLIIPTANHTEVTERHYHENPEGVVVDPSHYGLHGEIQLISPRFFEEVAQIVKQKTSILTYETCFYFGSSGSPVFDEYCNVVALHSAGYIYKSVRGERKSVIEYGYPLSDILKRIIIQIVQRKRFDVLKKYLSCSYDKHPFVMFHLKKQFDSSYRATFCEAGCDPEVQRDESLKAFFEYFTLKDEAMDTS